MLRLAVRVRRAQADPVLAELLELAPGGVEEVPVGGDVVEYAIYGAPGEVPALPQLEAAAGEALITVRTSELADDWDRRWRQFHRPAVLDGSLTVRPPWEPPGDTPIDLVIDPGQAFGTGTHATTRLCLELMLELERADENRAEGAFLDLGCGSGVLAIAAARLGWKPVLAIDNDPAAVHAARENARANAVKLEVRRRDLRAEPAPCASTVAANLLGSLLLAWGQRLREAEAFPQRVIASGLLEHEESRVTKRLAACGLKAASRRRAGEWVALLLVRD